jgi:hypothetical protein
VGHHRFKAIIEVIMKEPGTTNPSPADPAPADLTLDLAKEIKSKTKPKKSGAQYEIEEVIGWTRSGTV